MTTMDGIGYIGQSGTLETSEGLHVEVDVLDSRKVWARVDLLVRPVAGTGQAWIAATRFSANANVDATQAECKR